MSQTSTSANGMAAPVALKRKEHPNEIPLTINGGNKRPFPPPHRLVRICPQTGLPCEPRCLLYVGGRVRLCRHYRALAEQNGWLFIHHDGGLEVGLGRLASVLPRADAVICPVDCVSHGAMQRVRHFCKQSPTQLVLLRSASLSAFAKALEQLPAAQRT